MDYFAVDLLKVSDKSLVDSDLLGIQPFVYGHLKEWLDSLPTEQLMKRVVIVLPNHETIPLTAAAFLYEPLGEFEKHHPVLITDISKVSEIKQTTAEIVAQVSMG